MSTGNDPDNLREIVQDDARFQPLLESFIDAAVTKATAAGHAAPEQLRTRMEQITQANRDAVATFQTSSLENILLRCLLLGALKWDSTGLLLAPYACDPEALEKTVRAACADAHGSVAIEGLVDPAELLAWRRRHGHRRLRILTLQPCAAALELDADTLRPDLHFWDPGEPGFGLLVECTGFDSHHRGRTPTPPPTFAADIGTRKFAGMEIFRDPIAVVGQILKSL